MRVAVLILALAIGAGGCSPDRGEKAPAAEPGGQHDEHAGHGPESDDRLTFGRDSQARAGVRTERTAARDLEIALTTTGEVAVIPAREAHVSGQLAGLVIEVRRKPGDKVKRGDTLATLESLELGEAQAAFLEAEAKLEVAARALERQKALVAGQLAAEKEVFLASNQLRLAQIDLERTRNRLQLLGMNGARIAALSKSRKLDPTVPLTAPIGGVVVAGHLTLGERLDPQSAEPAFTLWDTSELWVDAVLYERDLARLGPSRPASVTVAALPGKTYRGRVAQIDPTLDRQTRTAKARIAVANPDGLLKPGMFANVSLAVGRQRTLAVPAAAVQRDKDQVFVFVRTAPDAFERRPVRTGTVSGGYVPTLAGLEEGDEVVVAGAFTLKSELLKERFGEHDH